MRAEGIAMSWAMKMRRVGRNAVALIVAGGFALLPPAVAAETLADTLIAAYRNANLLDRQRAVVRAADEDVAQAVAALRPVVAIAGSASDTYRSDMDATLSLTADLLLFDGGASRLAIEAARESVLATRAALVAEEQTVLLDAVVAYMDFRRDTQALSVAQNNVRVIARELEAARDRFEVGEITRTDVSQAEARLAEARSNLAVTRGDVEVSRAAFNLAVGELPGDLAPPPPEPALAGDAGTTLDVLDAEQELLDARLLLLQAERTEYVAVYGLLASMGLLTAAQIARDGARAGRTAQARY
jgi:outer membrane protein